MSGRHVAARTSEANPILAHARSLMPGYRSRSDERWFVRSMLSSVLMAQRSPEETHLWAHTIAGPDQIEHARRVLSKLAALS